MPWHYYPILRADRAKFVFVKLEDLGAREVLPGLLVLFAFCVQRPILPRWKSLQMLTICAPYLIVK